MIDVLLPAGVPGGFLQIGDCWLVGCATCGHPVAVAFSYPDAEIPDFRLEMFVNLVFGLSGFPRDDAAAWEDLAGVVVLYNLDAPDHPLVWLVYPRPQDAAPIPRDAVVDWIRAAGLQATGHYCGALTSAA